MQLTITVIVPIHIRGIRTAVTAQGIRTAVTAQGIRTAVTASVIQTTSLGLYLSLMTTAPFANFWLKASS